MAKEQSFEDVNKKITLLSINLQKILGQYAKLKSEGKSFAEINEILGKNIDSLSKKVVSVSNATARYGKQLNVTDEQRKITSGNLTRAAAIHEKLTAAVNKTRVAEEKATTSTKGFGDGLKSAFSGQSIGRAIGSVLKFVGAYQLLSLVSSAVKDVILGSITAFIKFEDSIGKLRAVTGSTSEQTVAMTAAIRETAIQTRFTSDEVASLAIELAKLGAKSSEIPNLILPIATAAQAIGASLSEVGEAVFKVNNQFGLSSAETASTAQILVSAINDSALSLSSFTTAMQYVGPLADQVGLSLSETASFLQVLSDNGFTASRIGTGLRKIFIDIKKPGEDLTVTLENLAKQNISLAEANELVGKTAAAQLITILRNLDAFKEAADESTRLTSSLKASAAQMSTTAGSIDILKSSYEDLKISIGAAITSSELFTETIGFIFPQAEKLIRGYRLLDETLSTTSGAKIAREELKELSAGVINSSSVLKTTFDILKRNAPGDEFITVFENLGKAGLTLSQSQEALSKFGQNEQFLNRYLKSLKLTREQTLAVNAALKNTTMSSDELQDSFIGFKGFQEIIRGQAEESQKATKIENARLATYKEFEARIKRISNLQATDPEAANLASQKLELEIRDKIVKAQERLNEESEKGILADKEKILNITGEVSGYEKAIQALSEFGGISDEQAAVNKKRSEAEKKAREDRAKADVDAIKDRRDNIKEELKRIKDQADEEISLAKEKTKLILEDQSISVEKRAEIENELAVEIGKSNEKAVGLIDDQLEKLGPLYDDASKAVNDFGKEFPNLVDDLDDSVGDVGKVLGDLSGQFQTTFLDKANIAIDKSRGILDTYKTQVQELNDKFGENAGKTKEYFDALDGITNSLSEELQTIANGLDKSTDAGKIAFEVIQQLIDKAKQEGSKPDFDWGGFWKEILVDSLNQALDTSIEAIDRFNEIALENTRNRLEAQKQLIQNQADVEDDILKARLENQLISETEYRAQVEKNRKKEAQSINRIEKQIFDAEQKRERQSALLDYLSALGSIVPELIKGGEANPVALAIKSSITAGFATAGYITELRAINTRQFVPTRFAEGGIVNGPSHAEGGVPFSVRGQGGYEMEGGEYIVNKRATQKYKSLLDQINGKGNSNYKFATGGIVKDPAQAVTRQIELLEAIASSNISMVGKLDKPVRSFVSATDLRSDENARRIQERNSQL
jgi:hypothetical protein